MEEITSKYKQKLAEEQKKKSGFGGLLKKVGESVSGVYNIHFENAPEKRKKDLMNEHQIDLRDSAHLIVDNDRVGSEDSSTIVTDDIFSIISETGLVYGGMSMCLQLSLERCQKIEHKLDMVFLYVGEDADHEEFSFPLSALIEKDAEVNQERIEPLIDLLNEIFASKPNNESSRIAEILSFQDASMRERIAQYVKDYRLPNYRVFSHLAKFEADSGELEKAEKSLRKTFRCLERQFGDLEKLESNPLAEQICDARIATMLEGKKPLIESMNESGLSRYVRSETIGNYSPEDWMGVLDNGLLNSNGKKTLAEKCPVEPEFLPILKHIVMGNGLGVSLAREIYSRERWEEVQELIGAYRVNEAKEKNQRIHNLGSMLGDRKAFFWVLNILFSKSVMKGIKGSIWSKEGAARLSAIRSLDKYNIDDTETIYLRTLDDSDKEIRDAALKSLKEKIPTDRLAKILEEEQEEASALLTRIQSAKLAVFERMSDLGDMTVSFGKNIIEKAHSGLTFLSSEASVVSHPIKSLYMKFLKKLKINCKAKDMKELPEALFALCIGLSWTDGEIDKVEKETLTTILKNNKLKREFAYWLIERPEISELKPYLKKIKNPEKTTAKLANTLKLQVRGEKEMDWIREIVRVLGIKKAISFRNEA
jgi:hypothetical protein